LTQTELRDVILAGHRVERDYNEYLCRTGDEGDTMFGILRGQVGVYLSGAESTAAGKWSAGFRRTRGRTYARSSAFAHSSTSASGCRSSSAPISPAPWRVAGARGR
jgi:hypothetical protein